MRFNTLLALLLTINQVSKQTGIANWLILSVAKVESNLKPYALNVAGKSYFPDTSEEAEEIIEQALHEGKSFDVGLCRLITGGLKDTNCTRQQDLT